MRAMTGSISVVISHARLCAKVCNHLDSHSNVGVTGSSNIGVFAYLEA